MPLTHHREGPTELEIIERHHRAEITRLADELEAHRRVMDQFLPAAVVWSGSAILDSTGVWDTNLRSTCRGLFVVNFDNNSIVVHGGARSPAKPGAGQGVHLVPGLGAMAINIAASAIAIYGTPGAVVDVQIFSHRVTPSAATIAGGVAGGTP